MDKNSDQTIDCGADPVIPYEGWVVHQHQSGGRPRFHSRNLGLHVTANQRRKPITGYDLWTQLPRELVLNANVLDFLLDRPEFVPSRWKIGERGGTRYIYFWGTIYRDRADDLHVRGLYWKGDEWSWCHRWLANDWSCNQPAAIRFS